MKNEVLVLNVWQDLTNTWTSAGLTPLLEGVTDTDNTYQIEKPLLMHNRIHVGTKSQVKVPKLIINEYVSK